MAQPHTAYCCTAFFVNRTPLAAFICIEVACFIIHIVLLFYF